MDKSPNFVHPVQWSELLPRVLDIVPAEHHGVVIDIVGALAFRDAALEDYLSFLDEPLVFNYRGAVTAGISDPHPVQRGGPVSRIFATATGAASSDTTYRLLVNGTAVGDDIVVPAGEGTLAEPFEADISSFRSPIPRGSTVQVESVTVGAGLTGAVVNVLLRG